MSVSANPAVPFVRLSGFYFFYFAILGLLLPYWPLYLKTQGFGAQAIGELMAVLVGTKLIAPFLWGWLADSTGKHLGVIRWACVMMVIAFAGVFWAHSYWPLLLVLLVSSFFWNAALPQFEVVTLNHLRKDLGLYGRIRLWGSWGFIATAVALGPLLDQTGVGILPVLLLVLFAGMALSSWAVPAPPVVEHVEVQGSLWAAFRQRGVLALFVVCFLIQVSHGPYYTFFAIFLEDNGYSRTTSGLLWGLGVLAEIGVFWAMAPLLAKVGAYRLMLIAAVVTLVRWVLLVVVVDHPFWLAATQVMHLATFGIYHAVAIHWVHRFFTGRLQGRGQALYSSLSFGAGGAVGAYLSGLVWDDWGAANTFYAASVAATLALVVAWLGLRESVGK